MTPKHEIIASLAALGIVRLEVSYSGGGDSGAVNTIAAFLKDDPDEHDVDELALARGPNPVIVEVTNKILGEKTSKLSDTLENFAYDALNCVDIPDWINNEGGAGVMTVFVEGDDEYEAGTIVIDHDAVGDDGEYDDNGDETSEPSTINSIHIL